MKLLRVSCLGLFLLAGLMPAVPSLAEESERRPLPAVEIREKKIKRTYYDLPIEQIEEGSPVWVYTQAIKAMLNKDYETMREYATPVMVWQARPQSDEYRANMLADTSFIKPLKVGDSGLDEDSAYFYLSLRLVEGDGVLGMEYAFFLKIDGRWFWAQPAEWQDKRVRPDPQLVAPIR